MKIDTVRKTILATIGAATCFAVTSMGAEQGQLGQAGQQPGQQQMEQGMPQPGQQVQISDARVVRKQGDRVFWIESQGEKTPVLLSKQAAQKGADLKEGDTIRLSGMVGPIPKDPQQLPIDQELAKQLQGERKFIFATEVQETPPSGGGASGAQPPGGLRQ